MKILEEEKKKKTVVVLRSCNIPDSYKEIKKKKNRDIFSHQFTLIIALEKPRQGDADLSVQLHRVEQEWKCNLA